jgi:RNA-directed DNA polymerase
MTTAQAVGAVSSEATEWYAIDWPTINRNARRLQVRIAQVTKEGSWGKVRALQRLLTHSYSGKALAVRRVTENTGNKTRGVDQEIWDTPEKKIQAVHALKRRAINLSLYDVSISKIGQQNDASARNSHYERSSQARGVFGI